MITSKEDLGAYSVIVSFLSNTIVPLISSSTFTVTFIKTPPVLTNTVGNQIIYKGMGLTSITIPSNIFSGTYTLTTSNNLSGVTATVFSLSGNTLSIQMPNSYQGSFTVTLTATDDFTQATTTSFVVTVSSCPQANWVEWKGSGSTDCTLCASGSVLSLGIWSSTSSSISSSSSSTSSSTSTQTESYLNRNISPISPQGIGAPIALAVASIIVSSLVSGASPVTAGFSVFQWQNIQIFSMIDMNTPDNYVSYSQGFEVTKLDFKFVNFISLQSSLKDSTRRFLSNNDYKSMTNIGFGSSHFLVNYWYFLLFFVILVLTHTIISLMLWIRWIKNRKNWFTKFLQIIKSKLEYGWYLHLLIYSSLIIFVLVLNDLLTSNLSTGINTFSFILSILMFCLLVLIMVVSAFLIWRKRYRIYDVNHVSPVQNGSKFIDKIDKNLNEDMKNSKLSYLYYSIFILRNMIFAIMVIWVSNKFVQLFVIIAMNVVFLIYVIIVRPFHSKLHNLVTIINEVCLSICSLLMISFLKDGSPMDSVGVVMEVIFSIDVIFWFWTGVGYSIFAFFRNKCQSNSRKIFDGREVKRYFTQKPEAENDQVEHAPEDEGQDINKKDENQHQPDIFPSIFKNKQEEHKYEGNNQRGERGSVEDSNFVFPVIGVK